MSGRAMNDDAELLERWANDDTTAAEVLVARYYNAMVRFFQTKAGSAAADLVQTTFLRCGEHAGRYSGRGSVRAFLYGIARNVLLEHYRSAARHRGEPDFRESAVLDLQPGAATMADHRKAQRALIRALQMIPLESQVILELFYWEGLRIRELATMLDVPVGTVKSRLHRGREQLREVLPKVPPALGDQASVRVVVDEWIASVREHTPR